MHETVLSQDALRKMAGRASTLWERLSDDYVPALDAGSARLVEQRLGRWRQVVAEGDGEVFRRRLAWDGLDEAVARRALGSVRLKDDRPLPEWANSLGRLLDSVIAVGRQKVEGDETGNTRVLHDRTPLPFEDILVPFVAAASDRLQPHSEGTYDLVTDQAWGNLERSLLERLSRLCAEVLFSRFSAFRAGSTSSLGRLLSIASDESGTDLYRSFAGNMRQGGIVELFQEYASLARAVATVVDQWVETTGSFLDRLVGDWPLIRDEYHGGRDPGVVSVLHCNLSDPHNGGRSTFLLEFSSGLKFVYKPRNLDTETNWFAFLAWLNANGAGLPFRCLTVINKGDYGWVEYAEHLPCAGEPEARNYYTRTGMLLCLVYALGGNDCHFENIIANGEQPILVDLETIMHPIRSDAGDSLQRVIGRERFESVIRTGMLPQWIPQSGGRALDTSALGAVNETQTTRPQPKWIDINTDAMRLDRAHMVAPAGNNSATVNGKPLSPNDHVVEIESGFRQMYDLLIDRRDELLDPESPLAAMQSQRVRFIFRGTGVYYAITERASRPDCLGDGAARSIELEALTRAPVLERERPDFWPLVAAERRALETGDIPYFLVAADSEDLDVVDHGRIDACFEMSCIDSMRERLSRLDGRDLARQIAYIRTTMQARVARHGRELDIRPENGVPAEREALAPDELVKEAISIAESIRGDALGDHRNGVAWMTVRYDFAMQRFQLEVSGPGLYDGGCGIALFLAGLDHVTGDADYRDLAIGALKPLVDELRAGGGERLVREAGLRGASGLGSFVYGLTRAGQLLGEPALLDDAGTAASLITPELIGADRAYDVIGGAAGAILGLLALHETTSCASALDRAVLCGHHLLARRTQDANGFRAWSTSGDLMLAGFAHGAAGIAYALSRLHEATGETSFREAALEAIAFENSLFSDDEGNWPDLRGWSPERPEREYADSWCNGGSGIGLARLGSLGAVDIPAMRNDIAAAGNLILRSGGGGVDHLCCGNLGRADILLEMGARLARPDLTEAAQARVAGVVHRAQTGIGYRLWWEIGGGISLPGMFQGMSGIGYALLRAAYPDRLPAVLLWQ